MKRSNARGQFLGPDNYFPDDVVFHVLGACSCVTNVRKNDLPGNVYGIYFFFDYDDVPCVFRAIPDDLDFVEITTVDESIDDAFLKALSNNLSHARKISPGQKWFDRVGACILVALLGWGVWKILKGVIAGIAFMIGR